MSGQLILTWILICVCGYLGYRIAVQCRRIFGVSPWRIPPVVWGLVCAFLPLLGILLETIAQFTTRRPMGRPPYRATGTSSARPWAGIARASGAWPGPPGTGRSATREQPPGRVLGVMTPPPTAGQPADEPAPALLDDAQPGERRLPGPEGWTPAEAGQASGGVPPLFGWYPDPTGRFEQRYWDGRHWADSVMHGSARSSDPVEGPN